jgi:hypothetical protein
MVTAQAMMSSLLLPSAAFFERAIAFSILIVEFEIQSDRHEAS